MEISASAVVLVSADILDKALIALRGGISGAAIAFAKPTAQAKSKKEFVRLPGVPATPDSGDALRIILEKARIEGEDRKRLMALRERLNVASSGKYPFPVPDECDLDRVAEALTILPGGVAVFLSVRANEEGFPALLGRLHPPAMLGKVGISVTVPDRHGFPEDWPLGCGAAAEVEFSRMQGLRRMLPEQVRAVSDLIKSVELSSKRFAPIPLVRATPSLRNGNGLY